MHATAGATRQLVRMRGRSYVAFVFTPEIPIVGWLAEIDATLARSPGFFVGKPVVLDLSALDLSRAAITHLVSNLEERNIRVLGIEGVDAEKLTTSMPPLLTGGRSCVITRTEPQPSLRKSRRPSRSRTRCCSKARSARASRSSSPMATSPCWVRSAQARKSSPADRSMFTARCAAGRWRASTAIRRHEFIARRSRRNCSRSTATTRPLKKSMPRFAIARPRPGCKAPP